VALTSLTVTGNIAGNTGGGIAVNTPLAAGRPQIWNSIIAGNSAMAGYDITGSIFSKGYNLVGSVSSSSGWNAFDIQGTDGDGYVNPGLGSLQDNGGWTQTLVVPPSSPAYRKGDTALQTNADPLNKDQRGLTRNGFVNGIRVVTIGAYDPDAS
jgi:hypothetical protein